MVRAQHELLTWELARPWTDKGHSHRLEHVNDMRRTAFSPSLGVLVNDLELAISLWEREVVPYEDTSG